MITNRTDGTLNVETVYIRAVEHLLGLYIVQVKNSLPIICSQDQEQVSTQIRDGEGKTSSLPSDG